MLDAVVDGVELLEDVSDGEPVSDAVRVAVALRLLEAVVDGETVGRDVKEAVPVVELVEEPVPELVGEALPV